MAAAPGLRVYDGVTALLSSLHAAGEKLAIVTKSPSMVPQAFIRQHSWPIDVVVAFHDVRARKPDPEGLHLALKKVGARAADSFHIGDQPEDTQASRAAGIVALGAAWGLDDRASLIASRPDRIFESVADLATYLAAARSQP